MEAHLNLKLLLRHIYRILQILASNLSSNHSGGEMGVFRICGDGNSCMVTLPRTKIAPENGWLQDYFPFRKAYFQGIC